MVSRENKSEKNWKKWHIQKKLSSPSGIEESTWIAQGKWTICWATQFFVTMRYTYMRTNRHFGSEQLFCKNTKNSMPRRDTTRARWGSTGPRGTPHRESSRKWLKSTSSKKSWGAFTAHRQEYPTYFYHETEQVGVGEHVLRLQRKDLQILYLKISKKKKRLLSFNRNISFLLIKIY